MRLKQRIFAAAIGVVLVFWATHAMRGNTMTLSTPSTTSPVASTSPVPRADVRLVGDRVVSVDSHQFSVGDPGDRVVLGDWDCDGTPTAAVARPSTGAVFVFDRWPESAAESTVHPLGTITDLVDLRTETRGNCSALFAVRSDGSESEVV